MEEEIKKSEQCVYMEHVGSMEYYQSEEKEPIQIFKDINFEAFHSQIWAIIGDSAFELRLLLEIIANARVYKDGKCILEQKGMMRKKRTILPHVYYVGSTNMLFSNMTVLEYLMFITAKEPGDVVVRQERIFKKLIELNLGYVSLTEIGKLTPAEKSMITLVVSLFTQSTLIIWNLARLTYDERSLMGISSICEEIRKQNRTLLFSSFDNELIERCATHIAPLYDGQFLYNGTISDFIKEWDYLCAVIKDERADDMKKVLEKECEEFEYIISDGELQVWDKERGVDTYDRICKVLGEHGYYPKHIHQHPYCVENAWKEIKRYHDLQP